MAAARNRVLGWCLLLCLASASLAQAPASTSAVHAELQRRGVGHRVRLIETDGEDRGRIIALTPDTVTLHADTGVDVTVQLTNIRRVRNGGLPHKAKVRIGWTAFVVGSVVLGVLAGGFRD